MLTKIIAGVVVAVGALTVGAGGPSKLAECCGLGADCCYEGSPCCYSLAALLADASATADESPCCKVKAKSSCCATTEVAAKPAKSTCCAAGADCCLAGDDCCYPGSPCCEAAAFLTGLTGLADCCTTGADCCAPGAACCETGAKATTPVKASVKAKADCCVPGAACCEAGAACCNK